MKLVKVTDEFNSQNILLKYNFCKNKLSKKFLACKNDTFHGMNLDTIGGSVFEK